jgi:hypothetical protein
VLLPRRHYRRFWSRILHDSTGERIAATLSRLPHVAATILPLDVDAELRDRRRAAAAAHRAPPKVPGPQEMSDGAEGLDTWPGPEVAPPPGTGGGAEGTHGGGGPAGTLGPGGTDGSGGPAGTLGTGGTDGRGGPAGPGGTGGTAGRGGPAGPGGTDGVEESDAAARAAEAVAAVVAAAPARRMAASRSAIPIGAIRARERVRVKGRIVSVTVQAWGSVPTLQCELRDETGSVLVAFLGRRRIPGIAAGHQMEIVGTAGEHNGRLVVINPDYHLVGTKGTD